MERLGSDERREIRGTLHPAISAAWLVLVLLQLLVNSAAAGTGGIVTLPMPGLTPPVKTPFTIVVNSSWVDGGGYRPVSVTITSTPPVPVDRIVSLNLKIYSYMYYESAATAIAEVEIPAGSNGITTSLSVPQVHNAQLCSLETHVDGKRIERLSVERASIGSAGWRPDGPPQILFVGAGSEDVGALVSLFPSITQYNNTGAATSAVVNSASLVPLFTSRLAVDLPQTWIDYTSLDVVCIAWSDLAWLKTSSPERWEALRSWVTSGGNLVVYGVGADWAELPALTALIGAPPERGDSGRKPDEQGWHHPMSTTLDPTVSLDPAANGYVPPIDPQPTQQTPQPIQLKESDAIFRWRDWQLGRVVALAPAKPFPGASAHWRWLLNEIGQDRFIWERRHGLSTNDTNPDFWSFLISGVGLPPVNAFRFLITVFVVLIGPVNYWVLMRSRRLHLLLLTVPASAVVVTTALMAYGLVSDGLGIRVRTRSYTNLDQRSGQAVSWARQSYYAAVAPSQGLRFPKDVAVLPLEFQPNAQGRGNKREIVWNTDQQLSHGWLNSRTMTQLVLLRSRTSQAGLKFSTASGSTGPISVENNLGTDIHQLLVCGDDGSWSYANILAAGGKSELKPIGAEELASPDSPVEALSKALLASKPQTPSDMDGIGSYSSFFGWGRSSFYYGRNSQGPVSQATSQLELGMLRASETLPAIAGTTPAPQEADLTRPGYTADSHVPPLGPRSYLAWVKQSPEVVSGVDNPQEVETFHLVEGHW